MRASLKKLLVLLATFAAGILILGAAIGAEAFIGPPPDPKLGDRADHFWLGFYLFGYLLGAWSTAALAMILAPALQLVSRLTGRAAAGYGLVGAGVAILVAGLGAPNWLGRQLDLRSNLEVPLIAATPGLAVGITVVILLAKKPRLDHSRRVA